MTTEYPIGLHGRLTRDPELRFSNAGKAIASFGVAENKRVYDRDTGEWKDGDPTFHEVSAFGQLAENICENLAKGNLVVVTGVHKQRTFEQDGKKRTVWEVTADGVGPSLKWKEDRNSGEEPPF